MKTSSTSEEKKRSILKHLIEHKTLALISSGILLLSAVVHFLNDIDETVVHENLAFLEIHHGAMIYALFRVLSDLSGLFENVKSFHKTKEA